MNEHLKSAKDSLAALRATDHHAPCGCVCTYNDMAHGDFYDLCPRHRIVLADGSGEIHWWAHLFTPGDVPFQAFLGKGTEGRPMCCKGKLNPAFRCLVHDRILAGEGEK